MLRDGEEDRQHAPAPLYIDHLDAPLPGIPAPRCKERRPPDHLHGVTVSRPEIVKFQTFRVRHLLTASACEMEMVARHQMHPGLAGKSIDRGRGTLVTKVYEEVNVQRGPDMAER